MITTIGHWVGKQCAYHGEAMHESSDPRCPQCSGELRVMTHEAWRSEVLTTDRSYPGFDAMMRWSEGKCFPDMDTLQNAYRQAMEGAELPVSHGEPWERSEL